MNALVGQWRATYTAGDWIVLSGPTSLVMLEPAVAEWSPLISDLWEGVVASASMSELASRLAAFRLDAMPSFAAFFWTDDSMRSLVRGAVTVVDLDSETIVATGEGIQTWSEVGLSGVTRVRVDTPAPAAAPLTLPLVVGAVRASSLTLDATVGARVTSPQAIVPVDAAEPDDLAEADDLAEPDGTAEPEETGEPDDLPDTEELAEPGEFTETEEPAEPGDFTETEEIGDPGDLETADTEPQMVDPDPDEPEDEPIQDPPVDEGLATEAMPASFANGLFSTDELENGDTQLMTPAMAPPAPAASLSGQDSMIMAVVCPYGHASSQNATACRICGSPIAPQGPQLVPRPVLAVLRGSDGTTTAVDRAVLIGRAPASERSNARDPRLMTVPSPGHDISRSHAEVAPEGWQIVVTDLHSTNGTVVVGPGGSERWELSPGLPTPVPLGSVMELGDGVSVLIDFPQ